MGESRAGLRLRHRRSRVLSVQCLEMLPHGHQSYRTQPLKPLRAGQNETAAGGRRKSMDAMGFGGMGSELDLSTPSSGNHTPRDSGQSWRDKMQAKAELKKRELESRHDEETAKARHDEIASISEKPIVIAQHNQLRADGPALSSVTPLGATTDGSAAEEPLTEECSEWSSSAEDSDDEEKLKDEDKFRARTDRV